MKIKMYMDVWGGLDPSNCCLTASNRPYAEKSEGIRRVEFTIDVPDYVFTQADVICPMPAKIEGIA